MIQYFFFSFFFFLPPPIYLQACVLMWLLALTNSLESYFASFKPLFPYLYNENSNSTYFRRLYIGLNNDVKS